MWTPKESVSLYWSIDGWLAGVRVARDANGALTLADFSTASTNTPEGLASGLSELAQVLMTPSADVLVIGGHCEHAVCVDTAAPSLPPADMRASIRYELPRQLPCESAEMIIGFRKLPVADGEESKTSKVPVRVFAIASDEWGGLMEEFARVGLKFDMFIHPCLAVDPLWGDVEELLLPGLDPGYAYAKTGRGCGRQMTRVEEVAGGDGDGNGFDALELALALGYSEDSGKTWPESEELTRLLPAMLQSAYALSPDAQKNKRTFMEIPKGLRIEHFKRTRQGFVSLLILSLLLACVLVARYWYDDWSRHSSLLEETERVRNKVRLLDAETTKMERFEKDFVLKLARSDPGLRNVDRCLYELSKIMPKDVWLYSFSTHGKNVDVCFKAASGGRLAIVDTLNSSAMFTVKNSNTRRDRSGLENVYVYLELSETTGAGNVGD